MSVKRLTELFESSSSTSDARGEVRNLEAYTGRSSTRRRIPSSVDSDDEITTLVPAQDTPRPARFIRHPSPAASTSIATAIELEDHHIGQRDRVNDNHGTADIANGHSTPSMKESGNSPLLVPSSKAPFVQHSLNDSSDNIPLLFHEDSQSRSSPTIPVVSHTPIPATVIFSRHAAPVYLPELDKYLEKIPPVQFSFPFNQKDYPEKHMFPPMDRLIASGESIAELETNKVTAPSWRSRATIFGVIESLVQSLAVRMLLFLSLFLL
jgi:hypothetical protein